jgi:hypothetical protein
MAVRQASMLGKKSPCGPMSERKDAILLLQIPLRPGNELRCSFYRAHQTHSCASSVPSEKQTPPGCSFSELRGRGRYFF